MLIIIFCILLLDISIGIETIWQTQEWQELNGNITCNDNESGGSSSCIIQCSKEYACGSLSQSSSMTKPYIKCPDNDECESCIINCVENNSCNNNVILGGKCKKVQINIQKENNKNMIIYAPKNGDLFINLISDQSMFDENIIYSQNTNNIIIDCDGNGSCLKNIIYGESIQNSLNVSCQNGNNCDQQEIHCPDNNQKDINPKCHILCDSISSCFDMNVFAMNGTKNRNGVSFQCESSISLINNNKLNCKESRIHCSDNKICNMEIDATTNEWFCDGNGICGDNNKIIKNISPITTTTTSSNNNNNNYSFPNLNNDSYSKFAKFSNTTSLIQDIGNNNNNDDDILNVVNDDDLKNNNDDNSQFVVLAYLLLGCVIGGAAFCLIIICIICCIVKNRLIEKEENQHNESRSSMSYTPSNNDKENVNNNNNKKVINDINVNIINTNDLDSAESNDTNQKINKKRNSISGNEKSKSHKKKPTTFGSMVISEMRDTINAIAGLESIESSTSKETDIDIPKPIKIRKANSDPRYNMQREKAKVLVDRSRFREIEKCLNDDLNSNNTLSTGNNTSNAATRGSNTNIDTLSERTDSDKKNKATRRKKKRPLSKPFKYNSRYLMESPSIEPSNDPSIDDKNDETVICLNEYKHSLKHRLNQSQPVLYVNTNQSLTVSTHSTTIVNSSSDESSSQKCSSSDEDDDDETSDDTECDCQCDQDGDGDNRIRITTTDLLPLSVIHSDGNNNLSYSIKTKKSLRRMRKQFSIAKSPKMDDIPEEQDLEMTPEAESTTHQNTTTTLSLGLNPFSKSCVSDNTDYTQTTTTNIQSSDDDDDDDDTDSDDTDGDDGNGHKQYQTMFYISDKHNSNSYERDGDETSTTATTTTQSNISDLCGLQKRIGRINKKLQESQSNNNSMTTINEHYTTYTDTMTTDTMTTSTEDTSETSNTSYCSD